MSTSINLTLPLQLADASGTIGTFLPEAKLRELLAERDSLGSALQEAQKELERLRQQAEETQRLVTALMADRDDHEKALTAAVRDQFDFDEERSLALLTEAETSGVDATEVLRQVEAICESSTARGTHAG
jgi:chromosome segregation ATPase